MYLDRYNNVTILVIGLQNNLIEPGRERVGGDSLNRPGTLSDVGFVVTQAWIQPEIALNLLIPLSSGTKKHTAPNTLNLIIDDCSLKTGSFHLASFT